MPQFRKQDWPTGCSIGRQVTFIAQASKSNSSHLTDGVFLHQRVCIVQILRCIAKLLSLTQDAPLHELASYHRVDGK